MATAAGIVLAWKLCRGRSRVWAVITLAFSLGEIWTVVAVVHHAPDQGISALLFEIFLTFAALYWFDFRRTSTGVLTSILGLVAWSAVFPVGLLCDYLIPAAQIPPELWNVPKYFVAFGMILTLLEDEFLAAGRAMEHYRLLFAAHPHPMWVQESGTLRILEVNDAAVAHYGYTREEFQSMTAARSAAYRRRGACSGIIPVPTPPSSPAPGATAAKTAPTSRWIWRPIASTTWGGGAVLS